jgi:two-component system chemotaxis sensor kinase CheA
MDPMDAIKQTFFQECEEQLAELETGLLAMETGSADSETVNAVFRAVHSIKGGAGAFALDDLVRFSHVFETAMDDVRAGRLSPDPDRVVKVMLRAADVLADLVRAARDGGMVDEVRCALVASEVAALSGADGAPAAAPAATGTDEGLDFVFTPLGVALPDVTTPTAWTIRFKPRADLYAKANETAILLRELQRLGSVVATLDSSALPDLATMDPEGAYLAWTIVVTTDKDEAAVREVFEFVEWDCELEVAAAATDDTDFTSSLLQSLMAPQEDAPAELDVMALIQRVQGSAPEIAAVSVTPEQPQAVVQGKPDTAAATATTVAAPTIRVDLERVDRLIDLVGELVINQAMLTQRVTEAGIARTSGIGAGLDELEQLSREIQDSVMAIRAQPVKSVFQRMPRLAREVAAMTGKQVRVLTEGEGTEVDKTVIERLADPLTHMIRNAIDHGLEKPDVRVVAGKTAEGTVRLSARHRSGRIVIEVSDDGAGINRSRVKAIAVERGLIAPEAVMSDEETDNLIFMAGFSTATEVSNISGRGVGMDVVKRSIQALGGRISITSAPGKGSTFTMSLPLTLAVLDGMVVSVGDQTLVSPLTTIVETLQPKAEEVFGMGGDARVISIRGAFVPLIDIGQALGFRPLTPDPTQGVVLLIESETGGRAALLVDAIQGQRQVVIKSLEANYQHVPGIAAATILGDGRVALILDIDTLIAVSRTGETVTEPKLALVS